MPNQNAALQEKIRVVDEVQTRLRGASASIVSEYRGLTVAELAELRDALAKAGGDYRIFKNTLVRRAIDGIDGGEYQPLTEYLSGPTALTFIEGDVSAVAKALRDFARSNPLLVIKGGLADGSLLSTSDLAALADLPPRDVLLARFAGALAAPMVQMAGLLKALPQNLAYGISALIDQKGGAPVDEEPAAEEEAAPAAEASAEAEAPAAAETEAPAEAEADAPAEAEVVEEAEPVEAAAPEAEPAEAAAPEGEAAAEATDEAEASE